MRAISRLIFDEKEHAGGRLILGHEGAILKEADGFSVSEILFTSRQNLNES